MAADFLKKKSPFSSYLGIETKNKGRSFALKVQKKHLNSHGIAHGGAIFSLADRAFAYAVNAKGKSAVAMEMKINYLKPALSGDVLEASARVIREGRQTTVCIIEVKKGKEKIAILLATAFNIGRS